MTNGMIEILVKSQLLDGDRKMDGMINDHRKTFIFRTTHQWCILMIAQCKSCDDLVYMRWEIDGTIRSEIVVHEIWVREWIRISISLKRQLLKMINRNASRLMYRSKVDDVDEVDDLFDMRIIIS